MGTDLANAFRPQAFDVALFAVRAAKESFALMARLKTRQPEMKLLAMGTGGSDEAMMAAITAGAKGWLEETASPEQILQALDVVIAGSVWAPRRVLAKLVERAYASPVIPARIGRESLHFTDRETEVLRHLVLARSNREIAQALSIREQTVKSYVTRLMRKVGVENRIALSMEAAESDWCSTE
jgi:DNA-binding NarL/FixJ family response regulator